MKDTISRQTAINALMPIYKTASTRNRNVFSVARKCLETIVNLPSAESKKGKWVLFEYGDDTWHKCTACGIADNYISIVQRPNGTTGRLESVRNFCPNCGADMRGEQDE